MERAGQFRVLTKAEEQALAKRIEKGDQAAKTTLIEHNIRLAIHVAKNYQNQGVEFEDLISEAVIGVERAAEKFDWRRNLKFSTYAVWWIKHMVQRAIHKEKSTIRVPGHIIERRRRITKYMRENPDATMEDAAEYIGVTPEQAAAAFEGAAVVASLDAPYPGEETGDRYGAIPDDGAPDPADMLREDNPKVARALATLTPIERRVIDLRFGFDGPPLSRDDTAAAMGVRPHVVQRSQRTAIKKLGEALSTSEGEEDEE